MWRIFVYLVVGLLIGYKGWIPRRYSRIPGSITTFGLIALLVAMGTQLGGNPQVVSSLSTLGWQALLLALGAVVGSTLLVFVIEWASNLSSARKRERVKGQGVAR